MSDFENILAGLDDFVQKSKPPQTPHKEITDFDDLLSGFDDFIAKQPPPPQVTIPEPLPFEFKDPADYIDLETMPSATTEAVPYDIRQPQAQQPEDDRPWYEKGFIPEKVSAFSRGFQKSIPFFDKVSPEYIRGKLGGDGTEELEQQIAQEDIRLTEESPKTMMAGSIFGHIAQGASGAGGVSKLLAKTAVAKSPLLMSTLSRVLPAIGIRGAQTTEEVIDNKTDIENALYDTLIESGGGAAFSMVPELVFPPGVAQAISQPLAELMYQAGVDLGKGQKIKDIFSTDWFVKQIPNAAMSIGFGIKDMVDPNFKNVQKDMQKELKKAFGVKPKATKPSTEMKIEEIEAGIKSYPMEEEMFTHSGKLEESKPIPDDPDYPVRSDYDESKDFFVPEDETRGQLEYEETKKYVPDIDELKEADKQKFFEPLTEKELLDDFDKFQAAKQKTDTKAPEKISEPETPLKPTDEVKVETKPEDDTGLPEIEIAKEQEGEFKRGRGLFSKTGAVGGKKQYEPDFKDQPASEMQKVFKDQRVAVKKKFEFSMDKFTDKLLSRVVDVGAPWKRRLEKNSNAKDVIMRHDLSRGASGEAARSYEIKEKEIYNTIPHEQENIFADYVQAKRSVELLDRKGKDFKTPGGENNREWLKALEKSDPKLYKSLETARQKYHNAISKEPLEAYVKEGLITRESADKLLSENAHYSPRRFLEYIDPEGKGFDSGGNLITVPDSGIKRLKEGDEKALINNPRLLLAEVQMRTQNRIFKNRANKALYDFVKNNAENELGAKIEEIKYKTNKDGKTVQVKSPVPPEMTRISSMVSGKEQSVLVPTEIAKYWVGQDPKINQDLSRFMNVVSGSAILKPMATGLNPGFALANLPRDIMHSWFTTKEYSPILPVAWAQQAKDMFDVTKDVIMRKGRVKDYSKQGGSMELLTQQGQLKKQPWKPTTPVNESIQQMQKFLGWAGETSELMTRMALRERAIKNGKTPEEATWIARNYIDFAQGGSWTKAANSAVPYLNAGIQGTRGVLRAAKNNPKIASFKAAQVISLGLGLAFWNRKANEEAWDSISDREKVTNFIITTPFKRVDEDGNTRYIYFKIAKDQGQRIFGTIGEELAEMATSGKVNFDKLQHSIKDFIPVDVGVSIPTFSALWGYMYNKDFWRNEDIWKGRKNITPKEEYWNSTPKAWKTFGQGTGLSPERSRRAFNKVMPQNVYTYLMEEFAGQMMAGLSDKEKIEMSKPFLAELSKSPISKRVIGETYPRSKQTETLVQSANKFSIKTHDKNGKPLPYEELKRNVEFKERQQSDTRIQNDREFDFLATAAIMGNEDTKQKFKSKYFKLRSNNPKEYKRIRNRLKRKYKKNYYNLINTE